MLKILEKNDKDDKRLKHLADDKWLNVLNQDLLGI